MGIVWAPDGEAVAFTITDRYAMCAKHPASHLARFDVATGEVRAQTSVEDRYRRVLSWNADDTLEVAVFDGGAVWFDRQPDATELHDARSGALLAKPVMASSAGCGDCAMISDCRPSPLNPPASSTASKPSAR